MPFHDWRLLSVTETLNPILNVKRNRLLLTYWKMCYTLAEFWRLKELKRNIVTHEVKIPHPNSGFELLSFFYF